MKKNAIEKLLNDLISQMQVGYHGKEQTVLRSIYAKHQKQLAEIPVHILIDCILCRLRKSRILRVGGEVKKRFLIFLVKILVSERVGIVIPDFELNDFSRWAGWGDQIKAWLEERQAKDERVL